jgi:hypothetical protein
MTMRTETHFFAISPAVLFLAAGLVAPLAIAQSKTNSANLKERVLEACQAPFETSWSSWRRNFTTNTMSKEQFLANLTYIADGGCRNDAQAFSNLESMEAQQRQSLNHWTARQDPKLADRIQSSIDGIEARRCVFRWLASPQCAAGASTTSARVDSSSTRGTSPTPNPSAPPAAPDRAQAEQRQAALDEQRRGKPKRNYSDRMAHQCVSLLKDNSLGGFTNTCTYPIRFTWCVHRPKKGAWSESFDCAGMGSFSNTFLPAGGRTGEHTKNAEKVLWFACRVDNPDNDIIEVGDAEFNPSGPSIRARCVKWGDRS